MVEGTPERFVPDEMRGQLVEAEHMARYLWASRFCRDLRVLDAGCGTAYGSAMLKRAGAAKVTAVDISGTVIEVARQSVPQGVSCEVADVSSLPYEDGTFDLIVCFETIEHVENPDAVLDELARVLTADGLLLISSPNRNRYVPGNPHHRHEYVPDELRAALAGRFSAVRLFGQHAMIASIVTPAGSDWDSEAIPVRRMVEPSGEDEVYTLAIAGRTIPDPGPPLITLTQWFEVKQWLGYYEQQQRLIADQAEMLSEFGAVREDRNRALSLLEQRERDLVTHAELQERVRELEVLAQLFADMQRSVSWRITAPIRRAKELITAPVRRIELMLMDRARQFLQQFLAGRR